MARLLTRLQPGRADERFASGQFHLDPDFGWKVLVVELDSHSNQAMKKPSHSSSSHSLSSTLEAGFTVPRFRHFVVQTLLIESAALKTNPLGDPSERRHPVLVPKAEAPSEGWPVVFVLAGFTGNGPNYFGLKTFEANMPETLDQCVGRGEAPLAVYVFCEAMTAWGGSQFLNSDGMGRYEDHIAIELVDALRAALPVAAEAARWCVAGGSSGGYGALHLASRHPERFAIAAAIAPDSYFEASLLPEIYTALPALNKYGGVTGVRKEMESGRFLKRKEAHTVLNVIAMGLCYAGDGRGDFDLPVDSETAVLLPHVWRRWKQHDPVVFLPERADEARTLRAVYLDAGLRDQFHLQFGTRQIRNALGEIGVRCDHSEFDGTHFDLGERRPALWAWLKKLWSE
jgi:enterochelin esterase family protein